MLDVGFPDAALIIRLRMVSGNGWRAPSEQCRPLQRRPPDLIELGERKQRPLDEPAGIFARRWFRRLFGPAPDAVVVDVKSSCFAGRARSRETSSLLSRRSLLAPRLHHDRSLRLAARRPSPPALFFVFSFPPSIDRSGDRIDRGGSRSQRAFWSRNLLGATFPLFF